eukprot:TRINITY_DN2815_c1_g8_i1.p1 TRINITY_DN2815_c1_g8~~TRINITY_DN2815_c1_g8_i1.p1  ORF type:complete len:509 (-),score=103.05 TRINITY_DN2815_c1_g8_i1:101-1627(-)
MIVRCAPSRMLTTLLMSAVLRCDARPRKGADYYAILGIPEKADTAALKKAYRTKSLEYHPDKCSLDDKDACQAKFIEVSTAYEVLNDPEKRKIYDREGEDGLKEGHQNQDQARAMFRQFFGREPDGNVRIINRGGQMMFQEEGEPGPNQDIYGDGTPVTELTADVYKAYIHDRQEPWLVLFYKPNNDDSVALKPEFIKFTETFKDFLNIGAVNCRQQRDTCSQASITDWPALRWFPSDKAAPPEVLEEVQPTAKSLGKWANSMMPDFTKVVQDKRELRAWLDDVKGPAVILFTDKSSPPPMWKALSREYHNRAALAVVPRCDKNGVFKTPLQREYDVRIPQIIRVDPVDEIGKIAEKFDSQMKMDVIKLWLMKTVAVAKRGGPSASFKELSKQRLEAGDCAPTDSQFCFLWLKAGADKSVEDATRQLANKYRTDPIKLMWVNVEMNPELLEAFGLQNSDATDFFVAFRPKRGKFKVHEGKLTFNELDSFVDGVMNGPPLTGKLPRLEL